jgi:predicted RNA-binding protein with RPS1 domain
MEDECRFDYYMYFSFYCLQKCSNGKYYLSLRQCHCGETPSCFPASSDGVEPDREISTINDIEEGLVLRGYLKAIDHNGAFVKLGRIVTGRVMICNLSDRYIRNYQSCYSQGELVRVKVIRVDGITKQVELSMKMSDVDPIESEGVNVVMEEKKTRKRKRSKQMEVEDGSRYAYGLWYGIPSVYDISDDEMTNDDIKRERITDDDGNGDESMPITEKKKHKRTDNLPPLPIEGGFNWIHDFFNYGSITDEEEEEEEDGDDKIVKGKMNRRQKKAAKKAKEAYLYKVSQSNDNMLKVTIITSFRKKVFYWTRQNHQNQLMILIKL